MVEARVRKLVVLALVARAQSALVNGLVRRVQKGEETSGDGLVRGVWRWGVVMALERWAGFGCCRNSAGVERGLEQKGPGRSWLHLVLLLRLLMCCLRVRWGGWALIALM